MNQQIRASRETRQGIELRLDPEGLFDLRYRAFLETVSHLRVRLHPYCARMTGSALDGEDIMQEALFEAYRKIGLLDDAQALRPWLFRIAHNRCIDFIRNPRTRLKAGASYASDEIVLPVEPAGAGAGRAIERLVVHLPPKERACVLLKDVLDHSLEEIADLVGSTLGGVKSALNRGRSKLAALPVQPVAAPTHDPELAHDALSILRASGTPCELEQLRGLPRRRTVAVANRLGVPIRIYLPYGPGWWPYAIDRALGRPYLLGWALRDRFGALHERSESLPSTG